MALIKAVLTYEPAGIGSDQPVPLGATADPRILRAVGNRLLDAASAEAETWRDIDAGLYAIKMAEAERLGRILAILLPDKELRGPARAGLWLLKPQPSGAASGKAGPHGRADEENLT